MANRQSFQERLLRDQNDRRPPSFAPRKKADFYCPMSPGIAWHWGLVYKECPLDALERDMEECASCRLRGSAPMPKPKKRPRRRKDHKDNKRGSKNRKKTE
jgi:hypothetical protein